MLLRMKAEGRVRTVGITTSEGRRHRDIERIMAKEPIDFVQVTYNALDREAEARILPLGARARHRRDRQPAVPRGRADPACHAPPPAGLRGGDRLHQLGAVPAQVRRRAPGRHLRNSRPAMSRTCRTWASRAASCRTLRCAPAWRHTSRRCDVGMVDLPPVRLSDVFAAHLPPAVRAHQRRACGRCRPSRLRPGSRCCGSQSSSRPAAARAAASSRRCLPRRGLSWPGPITSSATRPSTPARRITRRGSRLRLCCWPGARCAATAFVSTRSPRPERWIGSGLFAAGVVLYPLLTPLQGRPWMQAEIFGVAPDPTAVATVGALLLASGRIVWLLALPFLWCAISALTLWTMEAPDAAVPASALVVGAATAIWRSRQGRRRGARPTG